MEELKKLFIQLENELKEKEDFLKQKIINSIQDSKEGFKNYENFNIYTFKENIDFYYIYFDEINKIKYMINTLSDYLNKNE